MLHTIMTVKRIKMKVFPTYQWLETWVYEGTINSKLKLKSQQLGYCIKKIEKINPRQPTWEGEEGL